MHCGRTGPISGKSESMIRLSENFRALFYAPFYAAHTTGAFTEAGVEV